MNKDKELEDILVEIIKQIDIKREKIKENAKKTSQYRSSGKYKKCDLNYLNSLMDKRNTLVEVVNYIRSGDKEYLKNIYEED